VVRHRGRIFSSAPPCTRVAYPERDGFIRDGEKALMFGAPPGTAPDHMVATIDYFNQEPDVQHLVL
jgi:hypothetical protein